MPFWRIMTVTTMMPRPEARQEDHGGGAGGEGRDTSGGGDEEEEELVHDVLLLDDRVGTAEGVDRVLLRLSWDGDSRGRLPAEEEDTLPHCTCHRGGWSDHGTTTRSVVVVVAWEDSEDDEDAVLHMLPDEGVGMGNGGVGSGVAGRRTGWWEDRIPPLVHCSFDAPQTRPRCVVLAVAAAPSCPCSTREK
jgi:hypothetical protein